MIDWIGLDWIGLDWIGLDWIGLDWIGLDWIGLDWIGLDWIGSVIPSLSLSPQSVNSSPSVCPVSHIVPTQFFVQFFV
jgi:hypothetical protein